MNTTELAIQATKAILRGLDMTLLFVGRKPTGFPRGTLIVKSEAGKVYAFDPVKVLAWIQAGVKSGQLPLLFRGLE